VSVVMLVAFIDFVDLTMLIGGVCRGGLCNWSDHIGDFGRWLYLDVNM